MKRDLSNRRFFDFFRSSNSTVDARKAPKARDLRVESLEERQLLSATPCEIAPEFAETSAVGSIANVADSSPATWLVSLTDDDVEMRGTLRHALANAEAGDVVQFASSLRSETITLDGTELIVDKAITIDASNLWDAENNAPGLTISANNASRVFDIRSDAELNGLSITAGNARYGGGIYAYQVSLTLRNCSISNNVAIGEISDGRVYGGYGGGVYAAFCGETTFENCLFANNSAIYGGGVNVDCEVATFNNCLITNNSSDYDGGGAWGGCADATFNNCSITNNSSDYNGGGVELRCDNVGTFENCSISNNISKRNGGGVCFLRGDLSMSNCLISENSGLSGAGVSLYKMYSAYDVTGTFNSCSIVDNIGAGIGTIFEVSSFTLTNCTVAGNSYGISDYNCGGTIRNSIVAGNETDFYDSAIVNGYNTLSSFTNWSNKSQPDVVNYLYDPTSPLFVDPENDDYRLAPNVQAIDRGDNQYVSGTTDLAGNSRIVASIGSDPVVDLGAYEYQGTVAVLATPTLTVVEVGANSVTVNIGAVSNADEYVVQYSTDPSFATFSTLTFASSGAQTIPISASGTTYYFRAKATATSAIDSSWSTVVDATPIDLVEPNDTLAEAYDLGTLTDLYSLNSLLSTASDVDWFKFTTVSNGSADDFVRLVYQHNSSVDIDLSLCDANGSMLASSTASSGVETISLNNRPAGTYYLKIHNYRTSGDGAPYSLEISPPAPLGENDLDNPILSGGKASTDSTISVNIGAVANATGYVLQYSTNSSFANFAEITYSSNGSKTIDSLVPWTQYYVRVKAIANGYSDSEWTSTSRNTVGVPDQYESNDSIATATYLRARPGVIVCESSLHSGSDKDYFRFGVGAEGTVDSYVKLTYQHSAYATSYQNLDLSVYNSSGTRVGVSQLYTGVETVSLNGFAPGVYYACVYSSSSIYSQPDYVLEIAPPQSDNVDPIGLEVTTEEDVVNEFDGEISLREALLYAEDGDTITFADSVRTITLGGTELTVDKAIAIDASNLWDDANDAPGLTISANDASRVFNVTADAAITGLKITGGNELSCGGGIYAKNANVTLTDCEISENCATYGTNVIVRGGGICSEGGSLTLTNCKVASNSATESSSYDGVPVYGGGIYATGTLTLANCEISANLTTAATSRTSSYSYGAGIYATGTSTLTNCKVSSNVANASSSSSSQSPYSRGGGIYATGTLSLTNCEISANSAISTVRSTAYSQGGAVYLYSDATATLANCTVAGNSATSSGGVYGTATPSLATGTATLNNTIVAMNYGGNADASNDSNNVVGFDPLFVVAPQFDENGVLLNADRLDLRLAQGSWAIDRGDNQFASGSADLAGNPRIVASVGADPIVDIGAYEYQGTVTRENSSIVVTTTEDSMNAVDNEISLREALLHAAPGETITFASSLKGETITLGGSRLAVDKAITIDARNLWDDVNDAPGLAISGNGASRVIDAVADLSLYGLTITGGSNRGVSVNGTDSDLTIADCVFRENVGNGPAVEVWGASVNVSNSSFIDNNSNNDPGAGILIGCPGTVSNCSFVGNSAGSNMGGGATVYLLGDVAFENCSFVENSAGSGGAVCVVNSSEFEASFVDCSFENNAATYYGGAAHIYSGGNGRFVNCSFNGNATSYDSGYGGAVCVYNSGSNGTFESCSFKNNSSGTATVMSAYEGSATLTNCEIVGTVKKNDNYWHGGYFNLQGSGALVNCAISGNRYGIVQQNGTTNVYNSIIAGNDTDVSPSGTLNAYNTLSTFTNWTNANETGVVNYVYSPTLPLFADPENGDYRLAEDSQAVDLGDNSFAVGQTDLDGNPRVARTVDLGPYELNDSRLSPPAITGVSTAKKSVTFKINAVDGATSYRVEYSTDPTFETFSYKNYATTGAKTITGLDYGTTYYFRVRASANGVKSSGWTFFNAKTKNETFSDAPTLALADFDYNTITVDIGAVPNAGEYLVQYSTDSSFASFSTATFAEAGNQTISDLSAGTTYYLRVKATASGYDDSAFSETVEAATRPNETFSAAPTLTFVASGYNSITVDIGAVANAEQYIVQYSTYASFGALSTATFAEAGTQTISNLSSGTTYYLRVKATAPHYDDSAFSETVEVATPVVPEDVFEPNNSLAAAADLGTLTEFYSNDDLTIHVSSDNDWFKFTTVATGGTNDFIRLAHQYSSRVDLDVYLFNESGGAIASSTRSFGLETISLNGLSAGTYYIRVFNYSSAGVAPYSLDIAAPGRSDSDFTPMFVVTTKEDVSDRYDDKISLREALSYARAGESIGFADSMKGKTITLGGTELTVNRAITVDASNLWDDENDSPGLTIDANGQSRVLNAKADLNLRGLTIKGGASAGRGAGIDAEYSSGLKLTVENCVFTDNTADGQGGAVFLLGGGSVFEDCKFDRNSGSSGGAVKIGGSSSNGATFENCLFIDNSAVSFGGAVAVSNDGYSESESYVGDGTFVNCLFEGNAAYSGGAACVYNYGTGAFSNCSFTNNAAGGYGGGAFVQLGGSGTFANCSFTEHSNPSVIGGGVCVHGSESTGTFESCSFANNFSKQASVMFHYGSGTLTNCEIVGNSQVVYNDDNDYSLSGGAYFLEGSGSLVNCAIADNTFGILCANSTVNVYNSIVVGNGADVNSSGTINGYNALSTFTNWTNANETGVVNYVYDPNRPLFADPENGDYRLANGSQAVNLGDDSFVVVETDLDGNPRFVGAVDLGPYELQTVVSQLDAPAITGTTTTKVAVTFKINAVANATGYRVEYGTDPNFETFAFKNYTSAGAKTISGLDFGTTYYFRVKATADGYDDSDWTTFEAATKKEALSGAPTLTAASVGFDSVVLAIGTVANAEQYVVEYDTSDAFSAPTPVPFDAAGNATVSNLASNTTYCFRVKAIAPRYDDSAWSETVVATTLDPSAVPLDVPTIAALSGTKTAIVVKLEGVADAQKYVVEYATDASFSNASSKTYSSAGSKTISGLPTGTWYYVRVKATATGRLDSPYTETRKIYTGSLYATPSFTFSAVKTSVVLNIKPGKIDANQGAPEKYVIEYSENPDFSNSKTRTVSQGVEADGTLKPCKPTISGLTFGTNYYFRVKATGSLGNDSAWNNYNGKTIAAGQLAVPTFFTSKIGSDFFNVRCYNSASASGFEVMYSTNSDFSDAQCASCSASSGTVKVEGLSPNTKYYYKVRAKGDGVNRVDSTWSVIVNSVTTKAATTSSAVLEEDSPFESFFEQDELDAFWDVLAKSVAK